MKKLLLVAALAALGGCSSFQGTALNEKVANSVNESDPIKERTISSEWADGGVKLTYTLLGELDEIEVTASVPAYTSNYKIVAESLARQKLVEFVYGSETKTESRVDLIGQTIDLAEDNTLDNYIKDDNGAIDAEALEDEIASNDVNVPERQSGTSTQRKAKTVEKTLVDETRKISSSGRLVGWMIGGRPSQDGKVWIAVMKWSKDTQAASDLLRVSVR